MRSVWNMADGIRRAIRTAKKKSPFASIIRIDGSNADHVLSENRQVIDRNGDAWSTKRNNTKNLLSIFFSHSRYNKTLHFINVHILKCHLQYNQRAFQRWYILFFQTFPNAINFLFPWIFMYLSSLFLVKIAYVCK